MERVSIKSGKVPIILVSPHGFQGNDENTAMLTEMTSLLLNSYYVINRGWERDAKVDIFKDKANCNSVNHCMEDVVREEFLEPIINFKNRILKTNSLCYIYYIHGMASIHRTIVANPKLDLVVGWGDGNPASPSCDPWRANAFCSLLWSADIEAYQGKPGGAMAGWARDNMNQLFRKWYFENKVQSMQLEIIWEKRKDKGTCALTAAQLAEAMQEMLNKNHYRGIREFKKY